MKTLDDTQRLKQALSIVSGRLDVLCTMIERVHVTDELTNTDLERVKTYARKSQTKSDQLFECLASGEPLVK